jgi:hypothetical protein
MGDEHVQIYTISTLEHYMISPSRQKTDSKSTVEYPKPNRVHKLEPRSRAPHRTPLGSLSTDSRPYYHSYADNPPWGISSLEIQSGPHPSAALNSSSLSFDTISRICSLWNR